MARPWRGHGEAMARARIKKFKKEAKTVEEVGVMAFAWVLFVVALIY
jgi:hypothetical protein